MLQFTDRPPALAVHSPESVEGCSQHSLFFATQPVSFRHLPIAMEYARCATLMHES
jgi:hypothetical protein